jgi:hypothetical protein
MKFASESLCAPLPSRNTLAEVHNWLFAPFAVEQHMAAISVKIMAPVIDSFSRTKTET